MKQESFNTEAEILYNSHYVAIPFEFDEFMEGDFLPAGSLIAIPGEDDDPDTYLGLALHDVYMTEEGVANGALLVHGFVDYNKLPTAAQEAITSTVAAAMPMIRFINL